MKEILTHNITRWIFFIPLFLIGYILSNLLALWTLTFFYDLTFPINGFFQFLGAGVGISFIIITPLAYLAALTLFMRICPNYRIGGRVLFVIIMPFVVFAYVDNSFDFSFTKVKMKLALDICAFFALSLMSFVDLFQTED